MFFEEGILATLVGISDFKNVGITWGNWNYYEVILANSWSNLDSC